MTQTSTWTIRRQFLLLKAIPQPRKKAGCLYHRILMLHPPRNFQRTPDDHRGSDMHLLSQKMT